MVIIIKRMNIFLSNQFMWQRIKLLRTETSLVNDNLSKYSINVLFQGLANKQNGNANLNIQEILTDPLRITFYVRTLVMTSGDEEVPSY